MQRLRDPRSGRRNRISVSPPPRSFVSPFQKRTAGSGRITHFRSASCRWIGQPNAVRPLDHRGVVVRVRDRDRREPAFGADPRDDLVVEIRRAVPEDVAGARLDEERALADRERRLARRCRGCRGRRGCPPCESPMNAVHSTHCWPSSCGMYWRWSSQIGHAPGGSSPGGYCVPHALHRKVVNRVPAAPRTRRAACAGTCRPASRARAGSRSRRRGA